MKSRIPTYFKFDVKNTYLTYTYSKVLYAGPWAFRGDWLNSLKIPGARKIKKELNKIEFKLVEEALTGVRSGVCRGMDYTQGRIAELFDPLNYCQDSRNEPLSAQAIGYDVRQPSAQLLAGQNDLLKHYSLVEFIRGPKKAFVNRDLAAPLLWRISGAEILMSEDELGPIALSVNGEIVFVLAQMKLSTTYNFYRGPYFI